MVEYIEEKVKSLVLLLITKNHKLRSQNCYIVSLVLNKLFAANVTKWTKSLCRIEVSLSHSRILNKTELFL